MMSDKFTDLDDWNKLKCLCESLIEYYDDNDYIKRGLDNLGMRNMAEFILKQMNYLEKTGDLSSAGQRFAANKEGDDV